MTRDDTNNDLYLTGYLMTSLVYAVDAIGVTPVIETNIPERLAAQIWNIHYVHGQLGYADMWSYRSNATIGVCTPRSDLLYDYTYMEQHWYFITDYGERYTGYWASHKHGIYSYIH